MIEPTKDLDLDSMGSFSDLCFRNEKNWIKNKKIGKLPKFQLHQILNKIWYYDEAGHPDQEYIRVFLFLFLLNSSLLNFNEF